MNGARRLRFCALQEDHIGSVDPHALKIPARRAEYSLAESALSPFQAEPSQSVVEIPIMVTGWHISRAEGLFLLVLYAAYIASMAIGYGRQPIPA